MQLKSNKTINWTIVIELKTNSIQFDKKLTQNEIIQLNNILNLIQPV